MIISPENKKILLSRLESLAWRAGGILAALGLGFVSENIGLLAMPEIVQVIIGLAIAELTKYLNVDVPKSRGMTPKISLFSK